MAGTSPVTMLKAVMIFFSSCITSIILATIGGPILDILTSMFYNNNWYDVPDKWNSFSNVMVFVNIYYAIIYILPIIGFYILFVTIYHRYRTDRDEMDEYDYNRYIINGGRF